MHEIELKFLFDEPPANFWTRARALDLWGAAVKSRTIRSVYFDTAEHALKSAGIALRIRRDGRRWVQTVKMKRTPGVGLTQVGEIEFPAPGGKLVLDAIPDDVVRAQIFEAINGMPLEPVCETVMKRSTRELATASGTRAEVALDVGMVHAGGRSASLNEVEIELLAGDPRDLFGIAKALFPAGGLRFSHMSKSARGYLLAATGRIEPELKPRNARKVDLDAGQTAEEGVRDMLRECTEQVVVNVEVLRALDAPEGPHQLRVGLRRLRSLLSIFAPVANNPELKRLSAEAGWLAREVGMLRDLDVAAGEIVHDEMTLHPAETCLAGLKARLEANADERRRLVRDLLDGPRVQEFLLDLVCFVETRGWLAPGELKQTQRLAAPLTSLAQNALEKRWQKVCRRARKIETLDIESRHDLRKELKKLRYAIEFFGPLYPRKRVAAVVSRLKSLQDVFGFLNDAAMVQDLLRGGDDLPQDDAVVQRAVGWIVGATQARADAGWTGAKQQWLELKDTKLFWQ